MKPPGFPCQFDRAMSASSKESAEAPRPPGLSYVTVGRRTNFEYEVGYVTVGEPTARRSIAIILVTEFEDRVVVALPQKAWNKTVAKPGPSTKALRLFRSRSLELRLLRPGIRQGQAL